MGSCMSVHKTSQASALKLVAHNSKRDTVVTPASPTVVSSANRGAYGYRDFGSRDEIFFDSQPWFESDCDDDFFSVNGDFTPPSGNTPVHHSFSAASRPNKLTIDERPNGLATESSLADKKSKLIDLFKDSIRADEPQKDPTKDEPKRKVFSVHPKSAPTTPYVHATERTGRKVSTSKEKHGSNAQRCIPRLVPCGSFGEYRKRSSPTSVINGK